MIKTYWCEKHGICAEYMVFSFLGKSVISLKALKESPYCVDCKKTDMTDNIILEIER